MRSSLIFVVVTFVSLTVARAETSDILYVGDSHSYGCFGQVLDKELRALENPMTHRPFVVRSSATCGSASSSWLSPNGHSTGCGYRACDIANKCVKANTGKSQSLNELLKLKPKVTVVALGSNMLKAKPEKTAADVLKMISLIKESKSECIWVGPPQAAEFFMPISSYNTFVEALQHTVESQGCRYISSDSKTARGNLNDTMGLHYDCKNGTAWAGKVLNQMKPVLSDLMAPSRRSAPQSESGRATP